MEQEPHGAGESAVTPYVLAMLLCDMAIIEAGTSKKTLVGIFDRVLWPGAALTLSVSVYAKLTDAEGHYRFRLDYVHTASDRLLVQSESTAPLLIPDRLQSYELVLRLPAVVDEPGLYEFRLFANDVYLGRAAFTAVEVQAAGG